VPTDQRKVHTIAEELAQIESARMRKNVVYVLGTSHPGALKPRNAVKAVLTETFLAIPYRVGLPVLLTRHVTSTEISLGCLQ
jgi:hypothetical protein